MTPKALLFAAALLLPVLGARAGEPPKGQEAPAPSKEPSSAGPEQPKPPEKTEPPAKPEPSEEDKAKAARLAARVATLIKDLGSEDWGTRENAQAELVKIGEPAEKALEAAALNKDAEVAQRAKSALLSIRGMGYLGIYIADGPAPADEKAPRGCLVTGFVREDGREAEGLKPEDVILSVNGGRIDGVTDLQKLVAKCRPDSKAKLEVRRDGAVKTIEVKVYRWPEDIPRPEIPE